MNDEDPPRGADNEDEGLLVGRRREPARRSRAHSRKGSVDAGGGSLGEARSVDTGIPSDRLFIAGVEAAVAAGMSDHDDDTGYVRFDPEAPPATSYAPQEELLDWTEPPTGQVPRVLRNDDDSDLDLLSSVRGPVWREQGTDWDDETDLSHLSSDGDTVIPHSGGSIDDEDPFEFDFGHRERSADAEDRPGLGGLGGAGGAGGAGATTGRDILDTGPIRATDDASDDSTTLVYGPTIPTPTPPAEREIAWQSWSGSTDRAGSVSGSVLGEAAGVASTGESRPGRGRHGLRRSGAAAGAATGAGAVGSEDGEEGELAPPSRMRRRPRAAERSGFGAGLAAASASASAAVAGTSAVSAGTPAVSAGSGSVTGEAGRMGDDIRVGRGAPPAATAGPGRNIGVATLTGLGIGVIAILCFLLGSVATLALSALVVTAAGAECFAGMRRAGYRPATLIALVGIPTLMICAYLKGAEAITIVVAVFTVVAFLWYLFGVSREDPVSNIGATLAGFLWVGLLGSFAGLLLAPALFPRGNGVALLVGAIVPTVGYDVGAFGVGAWIGKHKLAPTVSPGKTWEGLAAGAVVAIVLAAAVVSQIKPWTVSSAIGAGIIVAVLAPIGDLCESMFKRSLGLKDMGSLLPAHGGVLDRIDALLFVLPALYVFVRIAHIT